MRRGEEGREEEGREREGNEREEGQSWREERMEKEKKRSGEPTDWQWTSVDCSSNKKMIHAEGGAQRKNIYISIAFVIGI